MQALKIAKIITEPLLLEKSNTGKFIKKINIVLHFKKAVGLY